jgi:hypothetical protein
VPSDVPTPAPAPELAAWLAANRESLIRRWLELVVERSTLEELGARPLAERLRELDLLLEAARGEGADRAGGLDPEVDEMVAAALRGGGPVAVALIAPPAGEGTPPVAWTEATEQVVRQEERVVATRDGLTVVVLCAADRAAAQIGADRVRAGAWQALGGGSRLPDVGVAVHPEDGQDAAGLVAAARRRLPEGATVPPAPPSGELAGVEAGEILASRHEAESTLRQELDRWAREDRSDQSGGERLGAEVTPLYPDTLD